jgi:hypothetical protein
MIRIPLLNAFICNGDFLLALMMPESTNPMVCRVHSALPPDQLVVTWWMNQAEVSARGILPVPPPVPMEKYSNLLKCRLSEVCELCSSTTTINIDMVKDIAFVFHVDTLEYDLPNCAGMSRVFYTRYRYSRDNNLVAVDCRQHTPFSYIVPDSFPSRIWHSILDVKAQVEKCLNDPKQYQPCKKMALLKVSLECWNYIFTNLMNSGAVVVNLKWNHTRKTMHCDLAMSSSRRKQYLTLLWLDSTSSISSA